MVEGFFTGTIVADDDKIQKTDRTFTFNLSYNTVIADPDSKLVVRFPHDFEDQFSVTRCSAISGFNSASNGQLLDC